MADEPRVLAPEEVKKIYRSDTKLEILEKVGHERIRSMRHMARRLDKDETNVKRHLRELEDLDIIRLERDTSFGGSCKVPKLKHDSVIAEPLVNV